MHRMIKAFNGSGVYSFVFFVFVPLALHKSRDQPLRLSEVVEYIQPKRTKKLTKLQTSKYYYR